MTKIEVPEEYVLQKFYEHAGYPKYKKLINVHEAGCPICREGRSWGKKRRLYYIPKESVICCHNCGWYSSTIKWIAEVTQMTFEEIEYELETGDYKYTELTLNDKTYTAPTFKTESLPKDSINLMDDIQTGHYKDNDVIQQALGFIDTRRLNTAINRPKALYLSLTDFIHKNRLCIPFYDSNNKIIHYQTRGILDSDLQSRPKYLSKSNSQKSLFNFNNLNPAGDNIFIFEGPLDSFFVRDSVALAGIQENSRSTLTTLQKQMLASRSLMDRVWVLDNQWVDSASYNKTSSLIDSGEKVFIWPTGLNKFKDFNEMCIHLSLDEITPKFLLENTYTSLSARLIFNNIKLCPR